MPYLKPTTANLFKTQQDLHESWGQDDVAVEPGGGLPGSRSAATVTRNDSSSR